MSNRIEQWILVDGFCFPITFYPLFVVLSWLLLFAIFKGINTWVTYSEDIDWQIYLENSRIQTLQIFAQHTIISEDIAKIIVNEYLMDKAHARSIWKYMNKQITLKNKTIMNCVRCYALTGSIFYVLCLVIIIINYIQYIQHSNDTIWNLFLKWNMLILYAHPIWKFVNCTTSLWILDAFDRKTDRDIQPIFGDADPPSAELQLFYSLMSMSYLPMILSALPAIIVVAIPAYAVYCPFACIVGGIYCCIMHIKTRINVNEVHFLGIEMRLAVICGMYMVTVIISQSVICLYNGGKWFDCFGQGFKSEYCPELVFDETKWQTWTLLITWLFF
eukprot:97532_1